ncbi:uncharacterized protein TNCV_3300051 [Trichonephila clavipes]|nr:uncharacterized protein TNCV_3300051 [Trichonephila clavipes]
MREEKLLDHVISRLEPQFLDYVGARHPQTTSNLLQIIDKYEKRFLNRRIRGSSQEFRDATQSASNRFPNRNRQENWRETRGNNRNSENSRPQRESNRFEGQGVGDIRRFDSRRRSGQSDQRFNNQGGRQGGSRELFFQESEWLKEVFKLLSDRCESGGDRSQSTENYLVTKQRTIRISSVRMTPVDLPYVPNILNERMKDSSQPCGTREWRNPLYPKRSNADIFHIDRVKRLKTG